MKRRSFFASLGAFLANLIPFKRPTGEVVFPDIAEAILTCNHPGCGNQLRKGEHLVCCNHGYPRSEPKDTGRRYVLIHGAVFPTVDGDPSFYPVDHDTMSEGKPRHKKAVTFAKLELYREPIADDSPVYPRYPSCQVLHSVMLGTIDEIVEDYRKKLETAARSIAEDEVATSESVQAQQDRFDAKYPRGEAHEIMFDHRGWKNFRDARIQYLKAHPADGHVNVIPPIH